MREALERAGRRGAARTRLIDLATVRIAPADGRPADELHDDTAAVLRELSEADVVLLATPVYRGSLSGVLKNLLDHVPVTALRDKPVAIAAMGATDHHFLGAERHLRDILAFFGALTPPNAVYLTAGDFVDGAPSESADARFDALLESGIAMARALQGQSFGPAPLAAGRA